MAQQTTAGEAEFENPHYKIVRCPSDNSTAPETYRRGYSFRPAAIDDAFELSHGSDDYDYWVEDADDLNW